MVVAAKNGHSMTPGKKAAGKTPTKTAKSGGEVSDEQLDAWATEDAAAMAQLIALIPRVHLKPQDQGRQIAKKYMKKVKDTVSDKVARAATDKRAKKRAKFDGSEPAEGKADRYRQIACKFTYNTDNTFMRLYTPYITYFLPRILRSERDATYVACMVYVCILEKNITIIPF